MTIHKALQQGCALLEEAGVAVPRLTAEVLLSHALGCERAYLYGHPEAEVDEAAYIHYGRSLYERIRGKPTQYITKRQEFFGREFLVTPDVLIPRPETEHLVEAALAAAPGAQRIVDVGCGSGAIAVTLSLERKTEVLGTDVSLPAIRVARENSRRLGARTRFIVCDVLACFRPRSLDLIVSNPPYVAHSEAEGMQREVRDFEPHQALFSGETGMEIYQRLEAEAAGCLRPGGVLVMELGFRAHDAVRAMLGGAWRDVRVTEDLAGIPRVICARLRED